MGSVNNLSLINSLCYTVGWLWCVLFGIHGHFLAAIVGVLFLIAFQLFCAKIKDMSLYIQDQLLVFFSIPLGALVETFFIQTNLIQYSINPSILPPIWIVFLYPLFSLLINHPLKIIKKNNLRTFLFGLFCAPLSYAACHSLGGLTFPYPLLPSLIIIGIFWGLFLCLLVKIGNIVEKAAIESITEFESKTHLKLLYDGECPMCKREICFLQKRVIQSKINFVDISSKEFLPSENNNIDYNTAMSQIHLIDGKGNLLIGMPAFATVYARCGLLISSTLLRIPFIKRVLKPLYTLFAKKRLWLSGKLNTIFKK